MSHVIAKRRGNTVRWRNKETGRWESGWFPLFVFVPKEYDITGLTVEEFNATSTLEGWRGR